MNPIFHKISLAAALSVASLAFSQIKEETLILNRRKTPNVQAIQKPVAAATPELKNFPPKPKESDSVRYEITDIPQYSEFKPSPIGAADLPPVIPQERFDNFVRLGMGNYGKILGDAGFGRNFTADTDATLNLHFDRNIGLPKYYSWDSGSSRFQGLASLNKGITAGKFNVSLGADYNQRNFYGALFPIPSEDTDLAQKITEISLNAAYDHYSNRFLDKVILKSNFLSDNFGSRETAFGLGVDLSYPNLNLRWNETTLNAKLPVGIEIVGNNLGQDNQIQNNSFQFFGKPQIAFVKGKTQVTLGADLVYLQNSSDQAAVTYVEKSKFYAFPNIRLDVALTPEFKLLLGAKGGVEQNSYASLLRQLPFLNPYQTVIPTVNTVNVYGGFRGEVSRVLNYEITAGYLQYKDFVEYLHTVTPFGSTGAAYNFSNSFLANYRDGSEVQLNAAANFIPAQNLTFGAKLQYRYFNMDGDSPVLNIPSITGSLTGKYSFLGGRGKISLGLNFVGERQTNNNLVLNNGTATYNDAYRKLPAFVDINASAEYFLHRNFAIFVMGDNLLNKNYEQFDNYRMLGAQVTGGLKVRF